LEVSIEMNRVDACGDEPLDHLDDSAQLLCRLDRHRSGSCRLPADVDDRRALLREQQAVLDRRGRVQVGGVRRPRRSRASR